MNCMSVRWREESRKSMNQARKKIPLLLCVLVCLFRLAFIWEWWGWAGRETKMCKTEKDPSTCLWSLVYFLSTILSHTGGML